MQEQHQTVTTTKKNQRKLVVFLILVVASALLAVTFNLELFLNINNNNGEWNENSIKISNNNNNNNNNNNKRNQRNQRNQSASTQRNPNNNRNGSTTLRTSNLSTLDHDWMMMIDHKKKKNHSTNYSTNDIDIDIDNDIDIDHANNKNNHHQRGYSNNNNNRGCVVFLAPQRHNRVSKGLDRFCLLGKALQSVDRHLNSHYGPYDIHVLVTKDWHLDPEQKDGEYTMQDRAVLRSFAPNSTVYFQEINLYSQDALEPNTNASLINMWVQGYDGSVQGRSLGYRSMCRLWSGRLQHMDFMKSYKYYMRMDDDSALIDTVPEDPFGKMEREHLTYLWRQNVTDHWGIQQLWEISQKHVNVTRDTPFLTNGDYRPGWQPYNNFHISTVAFWSSPKWMALWKELNEQHGFFKYRMGDANVHAIAVMLLEDKSQYMYWEDFPYRHNHAMKNFASPKDNLECKRARAAVVKRAMNNNTTNNSNSRI